MRMKYKKEMFVTIIVTLLYIGMIVLNILQFPNILMGVLVGIIFIVCSSIVVLKVEKQMNDNYHKNQKCYENLDLFRYLFSIVIMILHLRPFLNTSYSLDLFFNNIVGRICVPFFFLVSGYFVAKKERQNKEYIKKYVKGMLPLYLTWSILYIPIILLYGSSYIPTIISYIQQIPIPIWLLIPLIILFSPVLLLLILLYSGTYYHLWYFPALMLSLLVLRWWKKRWKIQYLLIISFVLLLFGATETYYGILPHSFQHILSYYFKFFFTTRNFLFFGLFYVTLGYHIGQKKDLFVPYSFLKLIICVVLLIGETLFLQTTERLNSNIILSCFPLTYYFFLCLLYSNRIFQWRGKYSLRGLSKYYYLIHPGVIYFWLWVLKVIHFESEQNLIYGWINIGIVLILTHILSIVCLKYQHKLKIPI